MNVVYKSETRNYNNWYEHEHGMSHQMNQTLFNKAFTFVYDS